MSPAIRLKKMPAPTSQAARAPDPPEGRAGSVCSVTTGGVTSLGQQPLEELSLVVEPTNLRAEPLDLTLEERDPVGQQVVGAGERAPLDARRERPSDLRVQHDREHGDEQDQDDDERPDQAAPPSRRRRVAGIG